MSEIDPQGTDFMLHEILASDTALPLGLTLRQRVQNFTINGLDPDHPLFGLGHSFGIDGFGGEDGERYTGTVQIHTKQDEAGWSESVAVGFVIDPTLQERDASAIEPAFPIDATPNDIIVSALHALADRTDNEIQEQEAVLPRMSRLLRNAKAIAGMLGCVSVGLFAIEIATDSTANPRTTLIEQLAGITMAGAYVLGFGAVILGEDKGRLRTGISNAKSRLAALAQQKDAVVNHGITLVNTDGVKATETIAVAFGEKS